MPAQSSKGFEPIARVDARLLVLGSLPGQKSLADHEYYAHPQNAFWPIMRELYGTSGTYKERCEHLTTQQIAVWDVLQASVRPGSLDSDIRQETAVVNDFEKFLKDHIHIEKIAFNGRKAEQLFRRMVSGARMSDLSFISLPSTSPAFAAMPFARKLELWRAALMPITTH